MNDQTSTKRDFSTISPSAKALLLMKGLTPIPYAREAAALMMAPAPFTQDHSDKDAGFWGRVAHFEVRYQSISKLLAGLPVKNILEMSSGFSFRGLDIVQQQDVYYIDTDLAGIIDQKKQFLKNLQRKEATAGKLETVSLNALDDHQFRGLIDRFPKGPIAIVNEGLLMYLGPREKVQLCSTIHSILKERGGYWITADIYLKITGDTAFVTMNDDLQKFFDEHHIEDNKFDSIKAAKAFFEENGFVIDEAAEPDYAQSSALKHLLANTTEEQRTRMQKAGRIHTTWRLKVKDHS